MKNIIRKKILKQRKELNNEFVNNNSKIIFENLLNIDIFRLSNNIMIYIDFCNEVKTINIIEYLLSIDKNVIVPISLTSSKELLPSQILNTSEDLDIGSYGILEPKKDKIREFNPNNLDLIIMPGIGFDKKGNRIGFGAGYYDRFISKLSKHIPTIALAYEFQIIENIPYDIHDRPVDYIITEKRIINCKLR